MWSDTLLAAERSHLIHLALWGAISATLGTVLIALVMRRRVAAPIVVQFAIQTAVWGSIILAYAAYAWRGLSMRDVSGATRLDRAVWFSTGLDLGMIGIGIALAMSGWVLGRRLPVVGAGLGVIVQGLGLLVLHLTFISILARLI